MKQPITFQQPRLSCSRHTQQGREAAAALREPRLSVDVLRLTSFLNLDEFLDFVTDVAEAESGSPCR
ncbi:hypothetical protein E2C01_036283 [Portunus trituberculatus]|uniref:Uncharacterized protein n=1 Tax=Portunus trituberculatus TaxID=210409 RepID=A0A5B7FBI3_PORTR|nr:hypothetical protein [Portunus trituberculatus]